MEEQDIVVALCIVIMMAACHQIKKDKRRRRTSWVRPWLQRREKHGAQHALMAELAREDPASFKNFLRMDKTAFDMLFELVSPLIRRRNTTMRSAISPAERLSLTLRYLASGDSYQSLAYLYRVPVSTLSMIIPETCEAIYHVLKQQYLQVPDTDQAWNDVAKEFQEKWNFPNCIGAMDGKHIAIKCPIRSGSKYFNYKHFFSIILFAVVDADYKFIYVDVGCNGRISDGGVFANSTLYRALEENRLNIPEGNPLPRRLNKMPMVIVGDEAFPLKKYIMKPYPNRNLDASKRIFNYRLSRARRIVENVFGILASRFGIFKKPIPLEPEKVEMIVLAACVLHNFLRSRHSLSTYTPPGTFDEENTVDGSITPGTWRQDVSDIPFQGLAQQGGNRTTTDSRDVREEFCDYFNTNGQVPWQWSMI